jgi:CDP-diacylglycerol---serine O-phosphatidyltransferase
LLNSLNKSYANTITLLNIIFGTLSPIYTMHGYYSTAAVFIILAVVMDGLDGRVARRLDIISLLGKELDSLCDLVSFGVAPALLIYAQVLNHFVFSLGVVVAVLYIVCGAYRLARFNVLNISDYFVGVPITMAGAIVAVVSLLAGWLPSSLIFAVLLLLALMMISTFKVPKY